MILVDMVRAQGIYNVPSQYGHQKVYSPNSEAVRHHAEYRVLTEEIEIK